MMSPTWIRIEVRTPTGNSFVLAPRHDRASSTGLSGSLPASPYRVRTTFRIAQA